MSPTVCRRRCPRVQVKIAGVTERVRRFEIQGPGGKASNTVGAVAQATVVDATVFRLRLDSRRHGRGRIVDGKLKWHRKAAVRQGTGNHLRAPVL